MSSIKKIFIPLVLLNLILIIFFFNAYLYYSKNLPDIDEIINYVAISDLYIGNDSFGHHLACQMDKPCFIILLNSPKAYSDYSKNQYRIIPPHKNIDEIDHGSKLDPNTISVDMVIDKIKKFI